MSERVAKFPIGTRFHARGKNKRINTIVDIYKTYNSKNELVMIRYVSTHDFMGQIVTDYDVIETTVAMGLITEE